MANDNVLWHPSITVNKYNPETVADITRSLGRAPTMEDYANITPDDFVTVEGNGLVNAGLQRLADLIIGNGSVTAFTATKGLIGVGNSNTAFSPAHSDLQGASKLFTPVASAPTASGGVISASALFASADANFAWEEWCFAIGSGTTVKNAALATAGGGSAVMLNRKVQSLGTKASGADWTLSATVTLS
ncbi:hypothetical protein [Rhodococcus phage REQ1]|uniref:hypothetical protein n=1 Tax=Rhodococcus phage REQ1 TaxID=1109712 RepID=UPI00023EEC60|nr:hypothetical protein RoPhREQ1_gp62 [Rhodococcus phage REQ1]AEV52058.1 hypothetical protein [Rhodococcus phage REQ1]